MRRRTLFAGATAALLVRPKLVGAQRNQAPSSLSRIGVIMTTTPNDKEGQSRLATFRQAMERFGWVDGRNLYIDVRWSGPSATDLEREVAVLVAGAPDLILANASASVSALLKATRNIPVVFLGVVDPVGAGFVQSLNRPGGNATGFMAFEYGISGKWLEILKEIAPQVRRVAVLRDPSVASGIGQFAAIQSVAPMFGVELWPIDTREPIELERSIGTFADKMSGGLIVTGSTSATANRNQIISLAERYKLPAVYFYRLFSVAGGLASFGADLVDPYRRAAEYADRILRGEKPSELPVQAPTKYELVLNLKTAKALGLDVPMTLLARADEVIE